jgi:hypothetical protein
MLLTDLWKHPYVCQQLGGSPFPGWLQNTGCCVGVDLGNAMFTLACIQLLAGAMERLVVPSWGPAYGKSRQILGMRGRGSGSLSSAITQAVKEFGCPDTATKGMPVASFTPTHVAYPQDVEYMFSDGANLPEGMLTEGKSHLIKTSAVIRNADQAKESLANLFPIMTGYRLYVGSAKVQDGVLLGRLDSAGGHSVAVLGYKEHPKFGTLFAYVNTWPRGSFYGTDPAGLPPGACWITGEDFDAICKDEALSVSQYQGYPASTVDWVP